LRGREGWWIGSGGAGRREVEGRWSQACTRRRVGQRRRRSADCDRNPPGSPGRPTGCLKARERRRCICWKAPAHPARARW